jgi:integrase
MNTVQPIRDKEKIHQMESYLKSQSPRDYILFELGIYSGLRISDILTLKVKDLKNQDYFILREKKTDKPKHLAINPTLKKELAKYLLDKNDDDYIIGSREYRPFLEVKTKVKDQKTGKTKSIKQKVPNTASNSPITREMAWNILNTAAKQVGLEEIGCHSLRKTFGYHLYLQTNKDIVLIQKLLNHSSPEVTLRYIGIMQDDMDSVVIALSF